MPNVIAYYNLESRTVTCNSGTKSEQLGKQIHFHISELAL